MDTKLKRPIRGVRLTAPRAPDEQRHLGAKVIASMDAMAEEAKRSGASPRNIDRILWDIAREKRVKRRGR